MPAEILKIKRKYVNIRKELLTYIGNRERGIRKHKLGSILTQEVFEPFHGGLVDRQYEEE